VVRLEPATAGKEDTCFHGGQEDLLFNLGVGLAGRNAGVLVPVDFDPVLTGGKYGKIEGGENVSGKLTNMPAAGATQWAISRGRCFSQA
jgi:hypothetical protein